MKHAKLALLGLAIIVVLAASPALADEFTISGTFGSVTGISSVPLAGGSFSGTYSVSALPAASGGSVDLSDWSITFRDAAGNVLFEYDDTNSEGKIFGQIAGPGSADIFDVGPAFEGILIGLQVAFPAPFDGTGSSVAGSSNSSGAFFPSAWVDPANELNVTGDFVVTSATSAPVPEPSALSLLGIGLLGWAGNGEQIQKVVAAICKLEPRRVVGWRTSTVLHGQTLENKEMTTPLLLLLGISTVCTSILSAQSNDARKRADAKPQRVVSYPQGNIASPNCVACRDRCFRIHDTCQQNACSRARGENTPGACRNARKPDAYTAGLEACSKQLNECWSRCQASAACK